MTRLHSGKVIAVGVTSPIGNQPSKVEIYDPFTDTWRETAPLNSPRIGHTAILLFDGRLLVVGGTRNEPGVSTPLPAGPPEVFDPATEKWTVIPEIATSPPFPNAWTRSNIRYLPNGKILVLSQIFNNTFTFDPATGNVKQVSSPRTNIGYTFPSSLLLPNGKVLFLSGHESTPSAEIFDVDSDSWVSVDFPRLDGYTLPGRLAVTLPNGNVMGLFSTPNDKPVSALFNPLTGNWSSIAGRNNNSSSQNAVTLPTGDVLAFEYGFAQIYNIYSGMWRTTNAPSKFGLGAVLLASGQVFTGNEIYGVDFGSSAAPTVVSTSSASYRVDALARGSLATAFGANLGDTTSIRIKDCNGFEHNVAKVFAVTPNQINYLLPDSVLTCQAELTFKNSGGQTQRSLISIAPTSPGIFTVNADGSGVPAAAVLRIKADGTRSYEPVAQFDAATGRAVPVAIDAGAAGEQAFLVLFGTGWKNRFSEQNVIVYIGGVRVSVQYVGAQGDFAGLDQMNILIPSSLAGRGDVNVLVTVDGKMANPVKVRIK
jgi:uncharacterized protein (TIGR03437 family)